MHIRFALWYNYTMSKHYDRGVFIDEGKFVTIRLWRKGAMVQNFSTLKPYGVSCHDRTIEVQFPNNPSSAQEAADRWASIVDEVVINP